MSQPPLEKHYRSVPSTRAARLLRLGGLTASIATDIIISASANIIQGRSPQIQYQLSREKNILKFVKELALMRGAALKVGQLLSMDDGKMLPSGISDLLANLRNQAYKMPPRQLKVVLERSWGKNFLDKFKYFDVNPIAAASIGQVHKCETTDGKILAVKVQYPGVKKSINSDIKNIGFLLSRSGLVPASVDLDRLLKLGQAQLHEETDYLLEATILNQFSELLRTETHFEIPQVYNELTTEDTLAMEFKDGVTIEKAENFSVDTRNRIIESLIALVLKELFEFRIMQTDPNYANFLFDESSQKVILLDFGATAKISQETKAKFLSLLQSTKGGNKVAIKQSLLAIGLLENTIPDTLMNKVLEIFDEATKPIQTNSMYDFTSTKVIEKMRNISNEFFKFRHKITIPDFEVLLIQRKIGGIFILATRLKAKIDLNKILNKYL